MADIDNMFSITVRPFCDVFIWTLSTRGHKNETRRNRKHKLFSEKTMEKYSSAFYCGNSLSREIKKTIFFLLPFASIPNITHVEAVRIGLFLIIIITCLAVCAPPRKASTYAFCILVEMWLFCLYAATSNDRTNERTSQTKREKRIHHYIGYF